jgi:hypothetical protein
VKRAAVVPQDQIAKLSNMPVMIRRIADIGGQGVMQTHGAGEDRVAAGRRQLQGMQTHCALRGFGKAGIGVKEYLAIRQIADRFAVLARVGDHHDRGILILAAIAGALAGQRQHAALAAQ